MSASTSMNPAVMQNLQNDFQARMSLLFNPAISGYSQQELGKALNFVGLGGGGGAGMMGGALGGALGGLGGGLDGMTIGGVPLGSLNLYGMGSLSMGQDMMIANQNKGLFDALLPMSPMAQDLQNRAQAAAMQEQQEKQLGMMQLQQTMQAVADNSELTDQEKMAYLQALYQQAQQLQQTGGTGSQGLLSGLARLGGGGSLFGSLPQGLAGFNSPESLTEAQTRASIVDIARSQLGINGRKNRDKVREYTRGRGGAWCSEFASYVLDKVGVDKFGYKYTWSSYLKTARKMGEVKETPLPGDIVIFKGHTALVESVNNDGTFTTIGGNEGNAVKRSTHSLKSKRILGFLDTV